MTSPFKEIGRDLSDMGFHVLPIMAEDKRPGEYRGGNWRNAGKWQRHRDTKPSDADLEIWQEWPDANIGIVLGSVCPVTGMKIVAVDIDTEDHDETQDLIASLPFSPMAKSGAKGITLFYRAGDWIRSKGYRAGKRALADLLTGNATKQTVVPPSMHPNGKPYQWARGPVETDKLPELTADHLAEFEEMLQALGWQEKIEIEATPEQIADDPFGDVKVRALANLEAWIGDLNLYKLVKGADGYRCVPTWRSSGTGRPDSDRKRSLSITTRGIRDHGADKGYSPVDLVMAALGKSDAEAFEWLEDKFGMGVSGDIQIIPSTKVEEYDEDDDVVEDEIIEDEIPTFRPFADDRGMINWRELPPSDPVAVLADFIDRRSPSRLTSLSIGSAVTIYGAAIARQYVTCYSKPSGVNTYIVGIAPTGSGKDNPLKMIDEILCAADLHSYGGPGQWTSASVLDQRLTRNPIAISAIDEFGDFVGRMFSTKSSPAEQTKEAGLKALYSSSATLYRTQEMAQRESERVYHPFLSFFAVGTPNGFYERLTGNAMEGGFFNRMIILNETISKEELFRDKSDAELMELHFGERAELGIPDHISGLVRRAHQYRDNREAGTLAPSARAITGIADPEPIVVDGPDEAKQLWSRYRHYTTTTVPKSDERLAEIYARTAENALRLATVLSVAKSIQANQQPALDLDCVRWACRFMDWATRRNWAMAKQRLFTSKTASFQDRIFHYIQERGEVTRRQLVNAFRRQADAIGDIDKQLGILHTSGLISAVEKGNKRGRPTVIYKLKKRV